MQATINNLLIQNNSAFQKIKDDLKKIDINLYEKLSKILEEQKFDSYFLNIKKEINSKKMNFSDIEQILKNKADISLLNDKISVIDFNNLKEYIKNIDYELKQNQIFKILMIIEII